MDVGLRFQRAQEEGAVSCFSGVVCHIYSAPATKLRGQKWTDVSVLDTNGPRKKA